MFKKFFCSLMVCLLILAAPVCAWAEYSQEDAKKTINEIFDFIYENHLSEPEAQQLMTGAIWGMLNSLGDPYSFYFSADELKEFNGSMNGDFQGVGVFLEAQPDYPLVTGVLDNSPAKKAGIKAGDIIKSVNGNDLKGWSLDQVIEKIKGPVDTEVSLVIARDGRTIEFKLKRASLNVPTVESTTLDGNIGYIAVKSFGINTAQEFEAVLTRLIQQSPGGLVIDLRDNPGGHFTAALEMSELFLKPRELIASIEDNHGVLAQYFAEENDIDLNIPVAVLINSHSASASELMAAALQENKAAVLVGEKTYGKGVIQSMIKFDGGDAVKITTAEYTTPKGRHLNEKGLIPDYRVHTNELQLPFAVKILKPGPSEIAYNIPDNGEVTVNGIKVTSRKIPLFRNATWYLPLRFTFEALGYVVSWEETTKSIWAIKNDTGIMIPFEGNPAVNGREIGTKSRLLNEENTAYISVDMIRALGIVCAEEEGRIILEN